MTQAYMEANDGKIIVRLDFDKDPFKDPDLSTDSVEEAAAFLIENNVQSWMNSSSMDFSSEYGFGHDGLRDEVSEKYAELRERAGI